MAYLEQNKIPKSEHEWNKKFFPFYTFSIKKNNGQRVLNEKIIQKDLCVCLRNNRISVVFLNFFKVPKILKLLSPRTLNLFSSENHIWQSTELTF